jgi:drug/metabolite transporter (DMT)-like permease
MIGYALLVTILLMTAAGQVAFKFRHVSGRWSFLVLAIALFVAIVPLTYLAVRQLGLATVYVFMSLSYGLVALLGWRIFGETIHRKQLYGILVIILGCVIYNF